VGQIDPLQPHTHQQHDFNPGTAPSGLLWTVRIPEDDVEVDGEDLDDGASMSVKGLSLGDYGTLANALFTHATPPVPAVVSFVLRWRGNTGDTSAADPGANRFNFKGILTHATLGWSASIPSTNFAFRSDSARTSHETFAELVKEGNGVFFGTEEDED
jgi:hypothetical protein